MRPPAIHQVYQICPDDSIVVVFGDGSIYQYDEFHTQAVATILAQIHGRFFNLPGVRRPKYPRYTKPYSRLENVPEDALLLYEEPPYRVTAPVPVCPFAPEFLHLDDTWNAWSQTDFACQLSDFTKIDDDNYSAGGCEGLAFYTNFGTFWRFTWTTNLGGIQVQSQGTLPFGTCDVTPIFYFGTTPPSTVEMIAGAS